MAKVAYVIEELYQMSTKGFQDFLDVERSEVDLNKASENGALCIVKKFSVDKFGKVTVEFYDRLEILTLLAKLTDGGDDGGGSPLARLTLEDIINARKELKEHVDDEME